ncbi:MAG: YbaN family protein [Methanobrevibacter sp.]|jgi:uncharacterized membrane protein YbaN (DUF454 family)|nr:YbaN family protein [Candidatus Methanovirga basalitermitum]
MKIRRLVYIIFGIIFLSLGAIGVFLPLMPTTPFVILAAFCFGKSLKRAENWILKSKYFGSYIENYRNKVGVPIRAKVRSIIFLWIVLIVSMVYTWSFFTFIILLLVGVAVSLHIYFLKTKNEDEY